MFCSSRSRVIVPRIIDKQAPKANGWSILASVPLAIALSNWVSGPFAKEFQDI